MIMVDGTIIGRGDHGHRIVDQAQHGQSQSGHGALRL
jgi:hypothetical protein